VIVEANQSHGVTTFQLIAFSEIELAVLVVHGGGVADAALGF